MHPKSINIYYNTVKYLKYSQTFGRIYASVKSRFRLYRLVKAPDQITGGYSRRQTEFLFYEPWNQKENLIKGKFTFLNNTLDLGFPPSDWEPQEAELLWKYNLHYFNYLYILDKKDQMDLCSDWVKHNYPGSSTGWDPYPLSLRIVNWCKAGIDRKDLLKSLYQQSAYLYRNLEFYHPANHYLENAKALIFAGIYFRGQGESRNWLKKGRDIIRKETPRQVLPDGAYFELSPMYHAIILSGYLDILNIMPEGSSLDEYNLSKSIKNTTARMRDYLYSITHPDGKIPLLNDSSEEIAPPVERILSYANEILERRSLKKNSFPAAGHYIFRKNSLFVIIDGGVIGPDHIPAHSHADTFTYELSCNGVKFITDSGVYEYKPGQMRTLLRSTRAHNTVTVDGISQAECWGSFRVARRYKPEDISFSESDLETIFSGNFSGYKKLIGDNIVHKRVVNFSRTNEIITVTDVVEGEGIHLVESRIHLNPSAGITIKNNEVNVSIEGEFLSILVKQGDVKVEKGIYSPRFGVKEENNVIVITRNEPLPIAIIYQIKYWQ